MKTDDDVIMTQRRNTHMTCTACRYAVMLLCHLRLTFRRVLFCRRSYLGNDEPSKLVRACHSSRSQCVYMFCTLLLAASLARHDVDSPLPIETVHYDQLGGIIQSTLDDCKAATTVCSCAHRHVLNVWYPNK